MKIQKILFIDIDNDRRILSDSQLYSNWGHHSIGLMYLASSLKEAFPDIFIKIFHTLVCNDPIKDIILLIKEFKPDLIGLRSLSIAKEQFKNISSIIKKTNPEIPILAGGPYSSSSSEDILLTLPIDLIVIGEGEITILNIVKEFNKANKLPLDIDGTAVLIDGKVKINSPQSPIKDLDKIPFPDYSLINLSDYKGISNHAFQTAEKSAFICSSRGCPYSCFYCHQLFGKKVRRRTAENIVLEMRQHIEERGIMDFIFVDDLFNVPMKTAKEVLSLIIKELPGIRLNFSNGLRADQVDIEMIDLLEKAGTVHIAFAIESSTSRLQKLIGKNLDIAKATKIINEASKRFVVCVFFMIGFPSETFEEAMNTVSLAEKLEYVAEPSLSIVTVYKGTPLYNLLDPNEEQKKALIIQETNIFQPKLLSNTETGFYGDIFPKDKVPLRGTDILEIRWEWIERVFNNQNRIQNSHKVLQKHLDKDTIIEFYRNLYDNPNFNYKYMKTFLKLEQ